MTPEQIEFVCTNTIYPAAKADKDNIECTFYDHRGLVIAISPVTCVNGYNDYDLVYAYDKCLEGMTIIPASNIYRIGLHHYKEDEQID